MTAPQTRAGGLDANAKGIAVLVVAALIGFLLLLEAGPSGGDGAEEAAPTPTVDTSGLGGDETVDPSVTTTPEDLAATTTSEPEPTDDERQPGDVSVLVLNGGGIAGAAGSTTTTLGEAGYQMGEAANAAESPNVETTAVYYAEGYQAEATAVAGVLGKPADVAAAMPDPLPGPGADAANVVVVLGKDVAPVGDDTTSTTAAG